MYVFNKNLFLFKIFLDYIFYFFILQMCSRYEVALF